MRAAAVSILAAAFFLASSLAVSAGEAPPVHWVVEEMPESEAASYQVEPDEGISPEDWDDSGVEGYAIPESDELPEAPEDFEEEPEFEEPVSAPTPAAASEPAWDPEPEAAFDEPEPAAPRGRTGGRHPHLRRALFKHIDRNIERGGLRAYLIVDPESGDPWRLVYDRIDDRRTRRLNANTYVLRVEFLEKGAGGIGESDMLVVVDFTMARSGTAWQVKKRRIHSVDGIPYIQSVVVDKKPRKSSKTKVRKRSKRGKKVRNRSKKRKSRRRQRRGKAAAPRKTEDAPKEQAP